MATNIMIMFKYRRGLLTNSHGRIREVRENIIRLDLTEGQITDILERCQDRGYHFRYVGGITMPGYYGELEVRNLKNQDDNYFIRSTRKSWLNDWVNTGAENPNRPKSGAGYSLLISDAIRSKQIVRHTYSIFGSS